MSERMSFTTLGGETVHVPVRGKHYVQPRGYAARPGTGPTNETCGSCQHLYRYVRAKTYLKCSLAQFKWTASRSSDVLAKAPACKMWEADHG